MLLQSRPLFCLLLIFLFYLPTVSISNHLLHSQINISYFFTVFLQILKSSHFLIWLFKCYLPFRCWLRPHLLSRAFLNQVDTLNWTFLGTSPSYISGLIETHTKNPTKCSNIVVNIQKKYIDFILCSTLSDGHFAFI